MNTKKNPLPKPVTILVLTLLTAFLWVSLSIYRAVAVKPVSSVPENISKSLTPTLNTNTIQDVEDSIFFPDSEVPEVSLSTTNVITSINTETPTPEPTVEQAATGSAETVVVQQ